MYELSCPHCGETIRFAVRVLVPDPGARPPPAPLDADSWPVGTRVRLISPAALDRGETGTIVRPSGRHSPTRVAVQLDGAASALTFPRSWLEVVHE